MSVCAWPADSVRCLAKADLMARETLTAGGRFTASIATPAMTAVSLNGAIRPQCEQFERGISRQIIRIPGASETRPATRLHRLCRLRRADLDPNRQQRISMSNQVYIGFAVSSHIPIKPTIAQFLMRRMWARMAVVAAVVNPHEPLGRPAQDRDCLFRDHV